MNRLVCPACGEASYCASLTGPLRCANEECARLLLPGDEVTQPTDRRLLPRVSSETEISVEYLDADRRVIEHSLPFVDVSVLGISTVMRQYPPLGSSVVVEIRDGGIDGQPWRAKGVVREVQPADEEGFRVGIEVRPGDST